MKLPLLATLTVALLSSISARAEVVIKDDTGATVRLKEPARRIVALAPHIAESLYAAGGGERLVGTVDYSDYPPEAKAIPVAGDFVHVPHLAAVQQGQVGAVGGDHSFWHGWFSKVGDEGAGDDRRLAQRRSAPGGAVRLTSCPGGLIFSL